MLRTDFAAGVIVFRQMDDTSREYLIVKNASGHWEIPKGHPEQGEPWLEAATRELHEETGLAAIELVRGFSQEIQYVFRDRREGVVHKTVRFALAKADDSSIQLSKEHSDFVYLPLKPAINRLTHAATRQLLRDADAYIETHMSA